MAREGGVGGGGSLFTFDFGDDVKTGPPEQLRPQKGVGLSGKFIDKFSRYGPTDIAVKLGLFTPTGARQAGRPHPSYLTPQQVFQSVQRGLQRGTDLLREAALAAQLIQYLRNIFSGGSAGQASAYPYPTADRSVTVYQPIPPSRTAPAYPAPVYGGGGGGATAMAYDFGGLASTLGDLAITGSQIYGNIRGARAFAEGRANGGIFDLPGVDLQSPIVSESTTQAQQACAAAMSPFAARAMSGGMSPQLHIAVNPSTGKLVHFAPVRITGVKPYNTGIRHRRSCSCRGKR